MHQTPDNIARNAVCARNMRHQQTILEYTCNCVTSMHFHEGTNLYTVYPSQLRLAPVGAFDPPPNKVCFGAALHACRTPDRFLTQRNMECHRMFLMRPLKNRCVYCWCAYCLPFAYVLMYADLKIFETGKASLPGLGHAWVPR